MARGPKTPEEISDKSYTVAVVLSGVFGVVGIHHFYIGRWVEGILDFSLFVATFALFMAGEPVWAVVTGLVDTLHTTVITIFLLTGTFKDGSGKYICYPGQRLVKGNGE